METSNLIDEAVYIAEVEQGIFRIGRNQSESSTQSPNPRSSAVEASIEGMLPSQ